MVVHVFMFKVFQCIIRYCHRRCNFFITDTKTFLELGFCHSKNSITSSGSVCSAGVNPMVEKLAFLLCMWEVPDSNLSPEAKFPERIFMVFPCPSQQIPVQHFKITHDLFLPHPVSFIVCTFPSSQCYITYMVGKVSLNKPRTQQPYLHASILDMFHYVKSIKRYILKKLPIGVLYVQIILTKSGRVLRGMPLLS